MRKELEGLEPIQVDFRSHHRTVVVQALTTTIPIDIRFGIQPFKSYVKRTEWILSTLFRMNCIAREFGGDPEGKYWVRKFDPRAYPDSKFPYGCAGCEFARNEKRIKCVILNSHHHAQRYV